MNALAPVQTLEDLSALAWLAERRELARLLAVPQFDCLPLEHCDLN